MNAEFYYGTNCDCCITLKFTKHILFFEREDCWEEEMLGRYTNIKFLYFSTLHNNDVKLLSKQQKTVGCMNFFPDFYVVGYGITSSMALKQEK